MPLLLLLLLLLLSLLLLLLLLLSSKLLLPLENVLRLGLLKGRREEVLLVHS